MQRKSFIDAFEVYTKEKELLVKALRSKENSYNFADSAMKLSKSGLLSHQRILQIKNGFFFYYKRIPKNWKTNAFDLLKENPKIAMRLSEILVYYLGNDEGNNTKYINMQINVKKLVLFQKGRNFVEDCDNIKGFL